MSEIDKFLYQLHERLRDGSTRPVGNGFVVKDGDTTKLVTAVHVAFRDGQPRNIVAIPVDRSNRQLGGLSFSQKDFFDIAESRALGLDAGLSIGPGEDISMAEGLHLHHSGGKKDVKVVAIAGIPVNERGKRPLGRCDNLFEYVSDDGSEVSRRGHSGSPVLNDADQVVGVHIQGQGDGPSKLGIAQIYTRKK